MLIKEKLKQAWEFLKEDSWPSFLVSLVLAFVVIKFLIFPGLSFLTGTALPLVIVESCSMYHSQNLDTIIKNPIYQEKGIFYENTSEWVLKRGFDKGDIIFVLGPKNLEVGDVIIFEAGQRNPIIHRIIDIDEGVYTTKGDNNLGLLPYESSIQQEQVLGKAVFRIPYLGWIKLIFFDWKNDPERRGFCS